MKVTSYLLTYFGPCTAIREDRACLCVNRVQAVESVVPPSPHLIYSITSIGKRNYYKVYFLVADGVPPGGDVSCFTNCAAQTTGQLECIQACTEEATSGSPSTSTASGTSRSMSCANGVCTVKTCDSSGNCVTSESDDSGNVSASSGDDAVTIPVPGVEQRSSSSSATVTASSGPDGVVTDVQVCQPTSSMFPSLKPAIAFVSRASHPRVTRRRNHRK